MPEPKPQPCLSNHPGAERVLNDTHQIPRRQARHHLKIGDGELSTKHRRPLQRGYHMIGQPIQPLTDHGRQRHLQRPPRRMIRQLRYPGRELHLAFADQPVRQFPRVQRITARPASQLSQPLARMPAHQIPHQLGDLPARQRPQLHHPAAS